MPAPVYDEGQQAGSSTGPGANGPANTNTYSLQNASATGAAFTLTGGLYGLSCIGSSYGTVTLQRLGPDGTTWLTASTAFAATGYQTAYLPPGQYKWAVATTTGVYTSVVRIPQA